jgi:hypothetical protein
MTSLFCGYYFYKDGMDKDFEIGIKIGLISMIIYFILSIRY